MPATIRSRVDLPLPFDPVTATTYGRTRTWRNFRERGGGYVQFTRDPVDFVEAALLVRAGWAVRIAPDLGGSYEEAPPNMLESLSRDRRWCQGNMQHLRVLFARRLHWMSRVNLLVGIMSFLSAPLWAVFVILTIVEAGSADVWARMSQMAGAQPMGPLGVDMLAVASQETQVVSLLALAVVLLLGPKIMGALLVAFDRTLRRSHAGAGRLTAGLVLEVVLSALAAPVMMVMHARFVVEVLAGRAVKWSAQQRDADRVSWAECWRAHGAQTLLGRGDANACEELGRAGVGGAARDPAMRLLRQPHLPADRQHRVERGDRVLEDHGDVATALGAQLGVRGAHQFLALEPDRALDDLPWRIDEAEEREARHGLARPALADEAEDLALSEREGHAIDRLHHARTGVEMGLEPLDAQDFGHARCLTCAASGSPGRGSGRPRG